MSLRDLNLVALVQKINRIWLYDHVVGQCNVGGGSFTVIHLPMTDRVTASEHSVCGHHQLVCLVSTNNRPKMVTHCHIAMINTTCCPEHCFPSPVNNSHIESYYLCSLLTAQTGIIRQQPRDV